MFFVRTWLELFIIRLPILIGYPTHTATEQMLRKYSGLQQDRCDIGVVIYVYCSSLEILCYFLGLNSYINI